MPGGCPTIPGLPAPDAGRRPAAPASRTRPFRTTLLLAAVSVLNAFDLGFTQAQLVRDDFAEANVLAAPAVARGPAGALAYKTLLFGAGALILFRCRRHWQSEFGAWVLLVCYTGLMFWWVAYLDALEVCICDPAVDAPGLPF